jgi:hypothetical protein
LIEVLQQTPLAVTDAPPSDVMLPPDEALVEVIDEIGVVVIVGIFSVVNVRSVP